jgi:hypothetical protein
MRTQTKNITDKLENGNLMAQEEIESLLEVVKEDNLKPTQRYKDTDNNILASFNLALGRKLKIIENEEGYYIQAIEKIPLNEMMLNHIEWSCVFGDKIKSVIEHHDDLSDGQLYDIITIPSADKKIGYTYVFSASEETKKFLNSMIDFVSSLVMIGKASVKENNK